MGHPTKLYYTTPCCIIIRHISARLLLITYCSIAWRPLSAVDREFILLYPASQIRLGAPPNTPKDPPRAHRAHPGLPRASLSVEAILGGSSVIKLKHNNLELLGTRSRSRRSPRNLTKWWQQLLLGPPLPHAPGSGLSELSKLPQTTSCYIRVLAFMLFSVSGAKQHNVI